MLPYDDIAAIAAMPLFALLLRLRMLRYMPSATYVIALLYYKMFLLIFRFHYFRHYAYRYFSPCCRCQAFDYAATRAIAIPLFFAFDTPSFTMSLMFSLCFRHSAHIASCRFIAIDYALLSLILIIFAPPPFFMPFSPYAFRFFHDGASPLRR